MKGITTDALFSHLLSDLAPFLSPEKPEIGPKSFACNALRDNLFKKLTSSRSALTAQRAMDKFLATNSRCEAWELEIGSLEDELLFGELKGSLDRFFTTRRDSFPMPILDSFNEILSRGSLGPGVSQGSESSSFYSKLFDSELTTTSLGLYRGYAAYIQDFPRWGEAEKNRLALRGGPTVVEGGRFAFVPKSDEIDRVICIEPVLNSFYQQGIRAILEDRLKSVYNIDLSVQQEKNRELARIGSANWKDNNWNPVTIDLSSASDSLGIKMLKTVLPREILDWLLLTSCRSVATPQGDRVQLHMISTMGNAFTFPLETILFCCIVDAAFRVDSSERRNPRGDLLGNWGVFGDDIIVPAFLARKVLRLLTILGFRVNDSKTFVEGPFRESCGADFFEGVDVRPVFCQSLDTIQDLYSLVNRLNVWSVSKGVPLRSTMHYLLSRVPFLEVPPWESAVSGVWVPFRFLRSRPKTRQGSFAYKRWVPVQSRATIDYERECIYMPGKSVRRVLNPEGLYLSFLRGSIRDGVILLRPKQVRYRTKVGIAPNWDRSPTTPNPFGSVGGPGLENLATATFWS